MRFIAGAGYRKGLGGLERLESVSVIIQLSVIPSLVVGPAVYGVAFLFGEAAMRFDFPDRAVSTKLQMLAGALLVVQGFETSRSLEDSYSREVRVASMRTAQALFGMLYIVSVILLMPVAHRMDLVEVELSALVDATHPVALVLPAMLMVGALVSRLRAAVADLGGGGGPAFSRTAMAG